MTDFPILPATAGDGPAIESLLDDAFGLDRRLKTSYRLREREEPAEGLSFVARAGDGSLAGAVSLWHLRIGPHGAPALLLGPLAVSPRHQSKGLGLKLMDKGISEARARGHGLIILVGDAPYYAKMGFVQVPEGQMLMPGPVDPRRLLALELKPGALAAARGLILSPSRFSGSRATSR